MSARVPSGVAVRWGRKGPLLAHSRGSGDRGTNRAK